MLPYLFYKIDVSTKNRIIRSLNDEDQMILFLVKINIPGFDAASYLSILVKE
jgi:hypothetical protein